MDRKGTYMTGNREQRILLGVILAAVVIVLIGTLAWDVSVLLACILILLEAALAVCMQNVPIWVHGAVVIAEVVTGAFVGRSLFLLLCGIFYVMCILALDVWNH